MKVKEAPNYGLLESDDVRTGLISGITFKNKPVQYAVVDGMAVFEGCIVLGKAEDLEHKTSEAQSLPADLVEGDIAFGIGITGEQYRWPNGLIPYDIDPALPNQQRVTDAVAHIESQTSLRFVRRTSSNQGQYPDYVYVKPSTGCWSYVGRQGGKQDLGLADGCGTGSTIHEFLHAAGLWHEQSREDRDRFVRILWENITAGREHNFNQHITDGDDLGTYDYGSIMHYPRFAFSKNGQPTIEPVTSGVNIGQRSTMSAGDVSAIQEMYRAWYYNKAVHQTFVSYHSQNAWANIQDLGWRKIKPGSPDGVTNMFSALCTARAYDKKVHVEADGDFIYVLYLV